MKVQKIAAVCVFVVVCSASTLVGQVRGQRAPKRVPTPDWSEIDVSNIFFDDAFREALIGERPAHLSGKANAESPRANVIEASPAAAGANSTNGKRWSAIVSSATIEDEIKRLSRELDASVTQPTTFSGGGYRNVRRQFSVLAMLFAIVHEYDGPIRWKSSSAAARDKFAYGASIAKVGTIQVYNAANQYKLELADLVRGDSISADSERGNWTELMSRAALMQRLEQSHQDAIEPALASNKEMTAQADLIIHEAELAAAMGQVLVHDGMEEWDDETYAEYCGELIRGAAAVVDAVKRSDYDAAVKASGVISKSCSNCHEAYRG